MAFRRSAKASGKVNRERLTQFGQAPGELGVQMMSGYSPRARGRPECWNRTWPGRLVAELRLPGISDLAAANRYIATRLLPELNQQLAQEAAEPGSAFVEAYGVHLDRSFGIRHDGRVVANENTGRVNNRSCNWRNPAFGASSPNARWMSLSLWTAPMRWSGKSGLSGARMLKGRP